jgi:hypothetical protein
MPGKLRAILLGVVGAWLLISPTPAPANSSSAAAAPSSEEHSAKGWAILRFEVRVDAPLDGDDVVAVRASSEAFAQIARATVARRENEEMARLQRAGDSESAAARAGAAEILFVAPDRASPRMHSRLTTHLFAGPHPDAPQRVYFRATTDGSGRIASLEVLFSTASEAETRRIAAFAQENLKIWTQEGSSVSLEVFGSLTVNPSGQVGFLVEG